MVIRVGVPNVHACSWRGGDTWMTLSCTKHLCLRYSLTLYAYHFSIYSNRCFWLKLNLRIWQYSYHSEQNRHRKVLWVKSLFFFFFFLTTRPPLRYATSITLDCVLYMLPSCSWSRKKRTSLFLFWQRTHRTTYPLPRAQTTFHVLSEKKSQHTIPLYNAVSSALEIFSQY